MSIVIGEIIVEKQPQACDTCIFYHEFNSPSAPWDIDAGCRVAYVLANQDPTEADDDALFELAIKGLCPFYEEIDDLNRELSEDELDEQAQRKINALIVKALKEAVL